MPTTLGTAGIDGKSLVRNKHNFDKRMTEVDFSDRAKREPVKVRGNKKTYTYGR